MTRPYKHTDAEDTRIMALLTSGLQTKRRRQEVIKKLSPNVLRRLLKRFQAWEPCFSDGAINSVLIKERLQHKAHTEMSLAVLTDHGISSSEARAPHSADGTGSSPV